MVSRITLVHMANVSKALLWTCKYSNIQFKKSLNRKLMTQKIIALLFFSSLLTANLMAQSYWDESPYAVREYANKKIFNTGAETPLVGSVDNITLQSHGRTTPVRIYKPVCSSNELPIILFIHGGAWGGGQFRYT